MRTCCDPRRRRARADRHRPGQAHADTVGGAPGDDRKRLRYIWIRGKKDQSSWEWMRRLARNSDEIEQLVGELGDGPWFVTVNLTSVVVSYHRDPVTGGIAAGTHRDHGRQTVSFSAAHP